MMLFLYAGIKGIQEHVFKTIYEEALKNEELNVRLQVFKMILSGVARSGKSTFWKRLAIKDFQPNKTSASTGAAESHFLSALENTKSNLGAHVCTEILFDLHLYGETGTSDLDNETLCLYKHILKSHTSSKKSKTHKDTPTEMDNQEELTPSVIQQSYPMVLARSSSQIETPEPSQTSEYDPISVEIAKCFNEMQNLLEKGEHLPTIPIIKKLCHLIDAGGQRAFLEMLPTLTIGKALYLIFFSYENFEKLHETVQLKHNSKEIPTNTQYNQMDVIVQSLICVCTTSTTSSNNVAMLVGTHVDEVQAEDVKRVNDAVHNQVQPFLKSSLVYAEADKLILQVSIIPNDMCSNDPEYYKKIIMNLVQNRLACPASEKLPASWYMFSMILRRLQHAGHSVLQYFHCEEIADKLYIKRQHLYSLLCRLHNILGIVMYFPEVDQLKDIVICDPGIVYKDISELIFDSFDEPTYPERSMQLKKWGLFSSEDLKKYSKASGNEKTSQLGIGKLMAVLEHLGVIAHVNVEKSVVVSANETANAEHPLCADYIIPCILNDVPTEHLCVQIKDDQLRSIIPLRIYFKCGFSPMGGLCYLFTKLISNYDWELVLPDCRTLDSENDLYWRNKVTFKVDKNYFVILQSTNQYYEINIVYSMSNEKPFKLQTEGHNICKKVWNAISSVLSKSPNSCLQEYKTASECIRHHNVKGYDGHIMTFRHNPDDNEAEITALCHQTVSEVLVDEAKQSLMVWFKV